LHIKQKCVESYERLKNLKLVADEVGIPWQTVYTHLRSMNCCVVGDKKRYGSIKDKLAEKFESRFLRVVNFAIPNNEYKYQAKIDFFVGDTSIDVKVSSLQNAGVQPSGKKYAARWSYCISKQKKTADFFVMYALNKDESVRHVFLIPKEIAITCTTISIPESKKSKWFEYEVHENELYGFFEWFLK